MCSTPWLCHSLTWTASLQLAHFQITVFHSSKAVISLIEKENNLAALVESLGLVHQSAIIPHSLE